MSELNSIGQHIIHALRAKHDQSKEGNVNYVDGKVQSLEGRDRFGCLLYINNLDQYELQILANRLNCDVNSLRIMANTLRHF